MDHPCYRWRNRCDERQAFPHTGLCADATCEPRAPTAWLDEAVVQQVLANPEQRILVRPGREVAQSRLDTAGRRYLLRVFVDTDRSPAEVVTAYRTSKVDKYWRR